jgi:hypothetical protein
MNIINSSHHDFYPLFLGNLVDDLLRSFFVDVDVVVIFAEGKAFLSLSEHKFEKIMSSANATMNEIAAEPNANPICNLVSSLSER